MVALHLKSRKISFNQEAGVSFPHSSPQFSLKKFFFVKVQLIYSGMPISAVYQSEPVSLYMCAYMHM